MFSQACVSPHGGGGGVPLVSGPFQVRGREGGGGVYLQVRPLARRCGVLLVRPVAGGRVGYSQSGLQSGGGDPPVWPVVNGVYPPVRPVTPSLACSHGGVSPVRSIARTVWLGGGGVSPGLDGGSPPSPPADRLRRGRYDRRRTFLFKIICLAHERCSYLLPSRLHQLACVALQE